MEFIDLEDGHPEQEGIYIVTIESTSGEPRRANAMWKMDQGFTLHKTTLQPEEYIVSWSDGQP